MNPRKNKALFLDRDGVINVEQGYVHRREAFVVTNHAGIARGYYSESEFLELTTWMLDAFAEEKVHITRVYYCPYHPLHGLGRYKYDSPDRKPQPGMLVRAHADFNLDLAASVLIGDNLSYIDAARAAGIGTTILLRPEAPTTLQGQPAPSHFCPSLDDIRSTYFILQHEHHD